MHIRTRSAPAHVQTRLALRLFSILLAALLSGCNLGGGQSEAEGVDFEQAAGLVLEQVVQIEAVERPLIVFGLPDLLQAGDEIGPYQYRVDGEPSEVRAATSLEGPAWFFWIDDSPGAMFAHPTRFVLVDASTGDLAVTEELWWPVLNGGGLWIGAEAYWDESNWVFSSEAYPPQEHRAASGASGLAKPFRNPARQSSGSQVGLVINLWQEDEQHGENFAANSDQMVKVLGDDDFEATYFGPSNELIPDEAHSGPPTNDALHSWFREQGDNLTAGDTLVVYMTGHGSPNSLGRVSRIRFRDYLRQIPEDVNVIVVLQGCFSGSFIGVLQDHADIIATSTDATSISIGDLDPLPEDFINPWSWEPDVNPDDRGSEFTSGFVEGWQQVGDNPALHQQAEQRAAQNGTSVWVEYAALASITGIEKDAGFLNKISFPQVVRSASRAASALRRTPISPTEVSLTDPTGDAISCTSGEALGAATNPAADLTGASAVLLENGSAGQGPSVGFMIELAAGGHFPDDLFGGVEFFDLSQINSEPNPQWVYDGIGNLNFSFTFNEGEFFPILHTYEEASGWSTTDPDHLVTGKGNLIRIEVPLDLIPPDSPFYFSITDLSGCDAIGLDEDGQASLYLPFLVE